MTKKKRSKETRFCFNCFTFFKFFQMLIEEFLETVENGLNVLYLIAFLELNNQGDKPKGDKRLFHKYRHNCIL